MRVTKVHKENRTKTEFLQVFTMNTVLLSAMSPDIWSYWVAQTVQWAGTCTGLTQQTSHKPPSENVNKLNNTARQQAIKKKHPNKSKHVCI